MNGFESLMGWRILVIYPLVCLTLLLALLGLFIEIYQGRPKTREQYPDQNKATNYDK